MAHIPTKKEVGNRVRHLREAAGLSATQIEVLTTHAGLTIKRTALNNKEAGASGLDVQQAIVLADVLDVSLDYLVTGKVHRGATVEMKTAIEDVSGIIQQLDERIKAWEGAL